MEPKKVYVIVREESASDHGYNVTFDYAYISREDAIKKMAELKSLIIYDWQFREAIAHKFTIDAEDIFEIREINGSDFECIYINEMRLINSQAE